MLVQIRSYYVFWCHQMDFWDNTVDVNCISSIMVSVCASSVVDLWFECWLGQTKDYEIAICYLSAALRSKSKDRLAQNQDNVSEWGDMSIHSLLLQWSSTIKIQLSLLVLYKVDIIIISLNITCSRHDTRIAEDLLIWC
jgi:hypothetical protein